MTTSWFFTTVKGAILDSESIGRTGLDRLGYLLVLPLEIMAPSLTTLKQLQRPQMVRGGVHLETLASSRRAPLAFVAFVAHGSGLFLPCVAHAFISGMTFAHVAVSLCEVVQT